MGHPGGIANSGMKNRGMKKGTPKKAATAVKNGETWAWVAERRIASDCEAGRRLMDEVLEQMQEQGWNDHERFSVQLALEEGIVNAIKHGNHFDPAKSVFFQCRLSADRIKIEIADQGAGFDPAAVPDCTCTDRLEVASGRGLLLMRSFMCHVEYEDGGTRLVMEKRKGKAA
jgi:serine/threonine-protein kinase RsbW